MDQATERFTHATALIIHSWSALDMAVQMELAGPESSNIRDWLGGVIVDMFPSLPAGPGDKKPDVDDLEQVLLQVLEDEYELRLEDDSAYQVFQLLYERWGLMSRLRGI
jgi:pre-rRNA-processing protein TSR2